MAWVYPKRYIRPGTATDFRDVMQNVNEYAREWNGLFDRDNCPLLGRDNLATRTFNECDINDWDGAHTLAIGESGGWFELPDMVTEVECDDGALVVDTQCQVVTEIQNHVEPLIPRTGTDFVEMQLLVDGYAVAETGWVSTSRRKLVLWLCGSTPVGAGTRRISVNVRAYNWYEVISTLGALSTAQPGAVGPSLLAHTFGIGAVIWRHMRR